MFLAFLFSCHTKSKLQMSRMNDSNSTADTTTDSKGQFLKSLINDFDLDVVDDALLHPEKPEYIDHFGFKVQVKTDNEYDPDTSESEDEFEDASSLKSDNLKIKDTSLSQEDYGVIIPTTTVIDKSTIRRDSTIQEEQIEFLLNKDTSEEEEEEEEKINAMEDWHLISSVEKLSLVNSSVQIPLAETSAMMTDTSNKVSSTSNSTATTSYYDILLSKFARLGNQDSVKQAQLKEETSHNLELLKEQSSKGDTDWGKFL